MVTFFVAAAAHAQPLDTLVRAYHDHPSVSTHSAVLNYANAHPKDTTGAMALLALGSGEIDAKQYPLALTHLKAAEKRLPTLQDYPAYLKAAAEFQTRDFDAVAKDLKRVWDNDPASPLAVKAVVLEANAYLQNNNPQKAIQLLEARGDQIAPSKTALLLAKAYEAAGDASKAAEQYGIVYTEYPLEQEAADAQAALARYPALSSQARLTRCSRLIDGRDYARARKELEALVNENPSTLAAADLDLARVLIGVAEFRDGDRQKAFDYLKSLNVAAAEPAAERLFYFEECARRLDRTDDMDSAIAQLAQNFPASNWRLQALMAAGNYYLVKNQPEKYEPLYHACYESFPNEPRAADCQWRVVWAEYMKDRNRGDLLQAYLTQFPASTHASAALYYLGRIATSAKDYAIARAYFDVAVQQFPNEYYGIQARDRMKQSEIANAVASPPTATFLAAIKFPKTVVPDMKPTTSTNARVDRAKLLASAGLDDLADSELRYGARHDGQPQVLAVELARLATQQNAPDLGIRFIKRYAPGYLSLPFDAATEPLWHLAFPLPFWKPLTTFAQQQGLDPYMVAGLVRQESEFNPKVVSYANAYGLAQVMPSTGRDLARRLKIRPFRTSMLFSPEVNLNMGAYYLRTVLDSLQGKWEAALASYNAGKSRVVNWLSWSDYREPSEFVESIPFLQTRDYVQSVLRNADIYRRLYGPNPFALASTDYGNGAKVTGSTSSDRKPARSVSKRSHRKLHRVRNPRNDAARRSTRSGKSGARVS